jgi:hypothetical protein
MPRFSDLPTDENTVLTSGGFRFWFSGWSEEGMKIYKVSGTGFEDGEIHISAEPPPGGDGQFTNFHITPERWAVGAVHFFYDSGIFQGRHIKLPSYERGQVLEWLKGTRIDSLRACSRAFWDAVDSHARLVAAVNAPVFTPAGAQPVAQSVAAVDDDDVGVSGPYYTANNQMYWLDDAGQPYYVADDGNSYPGYPPQ